MRSLVSARRLLLLTLALAATCTAGCGPGILSPATPPPPLFHLEVAPENALALEGPVRGALAWSVYSDELDACMDAVDVDGLIEVASDDPADPGFALIQQIQLCLLFSERGRVETDSVAVEAEFPASFTIPVAALPDESLLTGEAGARLGVGHVIVYVDGDGDDVFTETALGADAFVDRVVGTSLPFREDDAEMSFIAYREGELSGVWKIYRGVYGCADPPQGFSTVTVRNIDDAPFVECVIDAAAVPVELDDSGVLDTLACASDPDRYTYTQPGDQGLPAGAVGECVPAGDGYYDVEYTLQIDSVCPDVGQFNLVGCSDLTSEDACRDTFWDMVGNEPSWWPCNFGGGEQIFIGALDDETPATSGVDNLFTLTWTTGFGGYALERITVHAVVDDAGSEVELALADLYDRDGNGAFNSGDELIVSERADAPDTFDATTVPGNYPVVIRVDGEVLEAGGYRAFQPVPLPTLAGVTATGVDAGAPVTYGADEILVATLTDSGDGAASYALEDVEVHCYIGGEYPVLFTLRDDEFIEGTFALTTDVNSDGRFGVGDSLTARERENVSFALDPDGLASFSHDLYCSIAFDVGFNAMVYATNFHVVVDPIAEE